MQATITEATTTPIYPLGMVTLLQAASKLAIALPKVPHIGRSVEAHNEDVMNAKLKKVWRSLSDGGEYADTGEQLSKGCCAVSEVIAAMESFSTEQTFLTLVRNPGKTTRKLELRRGEATPERDGAMQTEVLLAALRGLDPTSKVGLTPWLNESNVNLVIFLDPTVAQNDLAKDFRRTLHLGVKNQEGVTCISLTEE